jgi:hypothetical protein
VIARYRAPERVGGVTHRVIPPSDKHGYKTACGIPVAPPERGLARVEAGYCLPVTDKGEPFDCPRCRRVLELKHDNLAYSIRRDAYERS